MLFNHLPCRIVTLLLILTALSPSSFAQNPDSTVKLTWGDAYELPNNHNPLAFIGNEQEGFVQVGHRFRKSLSFQQFDNQLHLIGEKSVNLRSFPEHYKSIMFTRIGSKYYWFFSTNEGSKILYAQQIDIQAGTITGPAHELHIADDLEINRVVSPNTGTTWYREWRLVPSIDSNKLLVQYIKGAETKNRSKENDIIGFLVFDQDMNKTWGKEVRMPYTVDKMRYEDYHLDSEGNVYMLTRVYSEPRGDKSKPSYRMEMLKWSAETNDVVKIPFKLGERFVTDVKIVRGSNNELMVAGYYSNTPFGQSADGLFLLRLDEAAGSLTNFRKGIYEFPRSVLNEFESSKTQRRNEKKDKRDELEAEDLTLRNVVVSEDGSIQVYGEEVYTNDVFSSLPPNDFTRQKNFYYYNDIIVTCIGVDGEQKWMTKIPKRQHNINEVLGIMSFKLFCHGSDQYLFFNESRHNDSQDKNHEPSDFRIWDKGKLVAVKIDESGNFIKTDLFKIREQSMMIAVTNIRIISEDKMIGRAFWGGRNQPVYISVD